MVVIANECESCLNHCQIIKTTSDYTNKRNVKSEKVKVTESQYVVETPKNIS